MIKPKRIKKGMTAAILSPSWGGPSLYPKIFENGIKTLRELGFSIKEYPTTRMTADLLEKNPELRAKDINNAFEDKSVDLIIASIGGEDSIKILPHLDTQKILDNPKIIMGYSDTSTILTYLNTLGLVTFHGPCVMSGFSQADSLGEEFKKYVNDFLFGEYQEFQYKPYKFYSNGYPDWNDNSNIGKVNEKIENEGWRFLQGKGEVKGALFGGCIETLEQIKKSKFWPRDDFWEGKILFFETSEDKPSPDDVKKIILGYRNIFDKVSAVLFGRARDYTQDEKDKLDKILVNTIGGNFGNPNIPIISNMDFGHTDPQFILPLGIQAKLDITKKTFKLIESPFI